MATPDETTSPVTSPPKIQISVGLWNVGEKAGSIKGKEAIHKTLESIQQQDNVEILLVQEVKSRPVYDTIVNKRKTHEKSEYDKSSGVSKAKSFVIISDHETLQNAKRLILSRFEEEKHRMDAFVVEIGDQKCLLASWHGKTTGYKHPKRTDQLEKVLKYLKVQQTKNKCDVCIMGGDFNLPIEKATEIVTSETQGDVHKYPVPEMRKKIKKPIIDFLVSWPQGKVMMQENPKPVDVLPPESKSLFGHQLIWYKLEIDGNADTNSPGLSAENPLVIPDDVNDENNSDIFSPAESQHSQGIFTPTPGSYQLRQSRVNELEKKLDELKKEINLMATLIRQLTDITNTCNEIF